MPIALESVLAVSVGNTNTRLALYAGHGEEPVARDSVPSGDAETAAARILKAAEGLPDDEPTGIVFASVNRPLSESIIGLVRARSGRACHVFDEVLAIPIRRAAGLDARVGQDRLLNALAAYHTQRQACVVVDAGTAVTVDFVDGTGEFQGGVIAPGAAMQLNALHRGTAALPKVSLERPGDDPFPKLTEQAMLHGVVQGIRGLVRLMMERFSEAFRAYPPLIVTGGDAALIFEGDELVDRLVPDLTLLGIRAAARTWDEDVE